MDEIEVKEVQPPKQPCNIRLMPRDVAPQGTFDKMPFNQLLCQYDSTNKLPPTIELTQAFLMTSNMKHAATQVTQHQAGNATGYFFASDYVADSFKLSLSESVQAVSKMLGNLGTCDQSTNFMLEQRSLMKAQSREGREIREMLDQKIVDGLEYVKVKEKIAETRQRVQKLLFASDDSDTDTHRASPGANKSSFDSKKSLSADKTRDDNSKHIRKVIQQIRRDAGKYLGLADFESMPLSRVYNKLQKSSEYKKKRQLKQLLKENKSGLFDELQAIDNSLKAVQEQNPEKLRQALTAKIGKLKQVLGLEKRVKASNLEAMSVTELDALPLNANSFELQTILFDFCGVNKTTLQEKRLKSRTKHGMDKLFGRIKKVPAKTVVQSVQDEGEIKRFDLIKVIGLEPEKLFGKLSKYKVQVSKMPAFSNVFDSYESFIPGICGNNGTHISIPGQIIGNGMNGGSGGYARQDGRNVISLNFNPFELDTKQKRKIYDGAIKEVSDQRALAVKQINAQMREKQEQAILRRTWINIAKKDIPKAFRVYQKYKQDLETNTKKLASNALKEVRKKAVRTQRLAKESTVRSKKLTKEMLAFWKKRDKELADIKRKKDKFDKELKKRQQEEEEALLQKKRLEYLMKQSEIYAHFMANKMGMTEEMKEQKKDVLAEEAKNNYKRVEVDEANARKRMARMINEDKRRLKHFDGNNEMADSMSEEIQEDDLDVNMFEEMEEQKQIEQPKMLKANLKHYQLKGLRWLDNLYEQGINGILADEMGLGKTIQAISLMAHIAESKGTWGPFLVVVPVTTLHNWQNELAKFCPELKVLPYFGSAEERKKLGKFLDPKNLCNPQMQIHVLITSYNLIVNNIKDQAKLMKIKWNYMILDEAQAIKNNASRRWKVLLGFQTRNRLLLTGTPIQNSMAELWALLHFIMPKLFDNHEQFQEWFSKDIEASSMNQGELNRHQLKRLHAVLKPFMLRRMKRDVEQEIAPKKEIELFCDMTYRQRVLYQRIKDKISTKDLFQLAENKQKMENLMNLVMQFRKVCNHPDLFERQIGRNPYSFRELNVGVMAINTITNSPVVRTECKNPITFNVPKLVFDECFIVSDNRAQTYTKLVKKDDIAFSQIGVKIHFDLFNIFNAQNIHEQSFVSGSAFGVLRLMSKGNGWSASELAYLCGADPLMQVVSLLHFHAQKHTQKVFSYMSSDVHSLCVNYHTCESISSQIREKQSPLNICVIDFVKKNDIELLYREQKIVSVVDNSLDIVPPLVPANAYDFMGYSGQLNSESLKQDISGFYVPSCIASSINLECPTSGTFSRFALSVKSNPVGKRAMLGEKFKPTRFLQLGKCSSDSNRAFKGSLLITEGILTKAEIQGQSIVEIPHYDRLITDCAKMRVFAELVTRLYAQKHRCLVFCQMTRMIDILEDFMTWKKMSYFKMDGSTTIQDRRFMVEEYQTNPNIFAFLLSTRAGGLGINLIAADTVIFYDNDWNPTMDEQATDRAHRIGQTKAVTVYRIVTRGTVEEKIVKRAKQKQSVQSTVYGDTFKMKEVVSMVMDDDVAEQVQQHSFIKGKRGAKKAKIQKPAVKEKGQNKKGMQRVKKDAQMEFDTIDNNPESSYSESSEDDEPAVNFRLEDEVDRYKQQERDEDDMDEYTANEAAGIPQATMQAQNRVRRPGRPPKFAQEENEQDDY